MTTLAEAVAKVQAELANPHFDSKNPYFNSGYASLKSVRDTVIPALAKEGVAVFQELTSSPESGGVYCTTHLRKGDQSLSFGPLLIPAAKNDAHSYGSACTYARRYSLMAVAGVVGDPDDDGNAAKDADSGDVQARQATIEADPSPEVAKAVKAAEKELSLCVNSPQLRQVWGKLGKEVRKAIGEDGLGKHKARIQGVPF